MNKKSLELISLNCYPPNIDLWSLFLSQVDVNDPATQQQWDTNPGQDEAVAKVSCCKLSWVLKDFRVVQSVNESSRKGG